MQNVPSGWSKFANHKAFVIAANLASIIPGLPGQRIVIHEVQFMNTVLQDVFLQNGQFGAYLEPGFPGLAAGAGFTRQFNIEPAWILDPGSDLYLATSAAGQVRGYIKYRYLNNWEGRLY